MKPIRQSILIALSLLIIFCFSAKGEYSKTYPLKLYPVFVKGKWGFIDKQGKLIVQPRYDKVEDSYGFSEGMIGVKENGKWGFINDEGVLSIPPQFDDVHGFAEGLCAFDMKTSGEYPDNNKRGYVNRKGEIIVKPIYDYPSAAQSNYHEGMCLIKKGDKYGYIDNKGAEIIPPKYYFGNAFDHGVASVAYIKGTDTIYCLIDKKGKKVVDSYKNISNISNGLAAADNGKEIGLLKTDGRFIPVKNCDIYYFFYFEAQNNIITIKKGDKYGLMNNKGELLTDIKYNYVYSYSEGMLGVNLYGHLDDAKYFKTYVGGWGFLDSTGKPATKMDFDDVRYFHDGFSQAKKNGKWGYINKKGEWEIKPQFDDEPGPFLNGVGQIKIKQGPNWGDPAKIGYIDKTGKYIWEPQM